MNQPLAHRRKIAIGTWRAPRESAIQTNLQVDLTPITEFIANTKSQAITITHIVGAALARAIALNPETNVRVVFGKVRSFPRVDISFAVDIGDGSDLAQCMVRNADQKNVIEISQELSTKAERLRQYQDENYSRSVSWAKAVPTPLMKPLMMFLSFWNGGLGKKAFGQAGHPLGSAFVSNVGRFQMREAYLAPLPFARTPIYMAIGEAHDAAVVIDGKVEPRLVVIVTVTADHRLIDGAHAGKLIAAFKQFMEKPALLLV
jgi:pyruvate dehydrogenase E2 component (dihydrolipoamide acetyltransferase)